jgi:putative colanic acid biosynthesis acetyltransferase WcaF
LFGAKVGKGVNIKPSVNVKYPWRLSIGNYTWIGENVWIDNLDNVSIGNNCCISQGAMLLCGNHNYKKMTFDLIVGEIILEDGVWIGAQSIVCPNVTCKTHSVLTVNSVATTDLEPYTIYRGNPAKEIRKRTIKQ